MNAQRTGDWSGAVTICKRAADQGSMEAQIVVGWMYLSGTGVPRDDVQAKTWLRGAAEQGNPGAQFYLGLIYSTRDVVEAAKWYRLAAEQGNAMAQVSLASMYSMGDGVPRDLTEAAKWYRLAAMQGQIEAQLHLGYIYSRGRGVPQDYAEAAKWLHKAAEYVGPPHTLCELYMEGKGVPQDDVQAHMWCSLVAMEFLPRSRLNELNDRMTPAQIAEAEGLARAWIETHEWFAPDPIVACDFGRRGVIHTRRTTCAEEGGRPEATDGKGISD